jgi:hypothetical protein
MLYSSARSFYHMPSKTAIAIALTRGGPDRGDLGSQGIMDPTAVARYSF